MAQTASDERGMKRICSHCSTRYYDFHKRPVVCPHCGTEFTGEIKVKSRRSRSAANDKSGENTQAQQTPVDSEAQSGEGAIQDESTVSLEDVESEDSDNDEDEIETGEGDLELDNLDEDNLDEDGIGVSLEDDDSTS